MNVSQLDYVHNYVGTQLQGGRQGTCVYVTFNLKGIQLTSVI